MYYSYKNHIPYSMGNYVFYTVKCNFVHKLGAEHNGDGTAVLLLRFLCENVGEIKDIWRLYVNIDKMYCFY